MALARILQTDKRTADLCYENNQLSKEVERLEDALNYYQNKTETEQHSVRGMIRKEIGGSRWQYGASGKLRDFRNADDLHDDQPSSKNKTNAKSRNSAGITESKSDAQEQHKRLSEPLKYMKPKKKGAEANAPPKPMTLSDLEKSEHLTTTQLAPAAQPPPTKQPKSCDPRVERWLEGLSLKDTNRYVSIFAENEFDMLSLKMLGDAQLREMGISAHGARNKILQGVKLLNGEEIVSKDLTVEPMKKKVKPKAKKEMKKKEDDLDTIPVREPKSARPTKASSQKSAGVRLSARPVSGRQVTSSRPSSTMTSSRQSTAMTSARPSTARGATKPKKTIGAYAKTTESKPKELKRTVDQSGDDSSRPVLEYELETAIEAYGRESKDDIISSLSAQVQKLLESNQDGDSKTVDMIVNLQEQISAIRLQMSQKEVEPKTTREDQKEKLEVDVEMYDDKKPKPISPSAKSLNDLTKITLLDGVRQQKNAYAKQIRHLELELERMRGADQQGCELPLEDLYYTDNDLVGEGVFSRVYRGSFQGVEVAVKRLKAPLSKHDRNYFSAEVSLLRELRHPRVVLLLGVTSTTHLPCMVFEWMGAGSLYDMLHAQNTPALDHVAYYQVAKDMAQGMNYLHRHKPSVLHLDLKSKNVLLNVYGRAKIGDFGFSKLRHEASINASSRRQSAGGASPSALSWMAPELLSAKPVTVKADVYSYGMILWEMLTRKEPYQGLSTFKVIEMVRQSQRPTIPESAPPRLSMLITQCWEQNQAKRPQFKDILITLGDLELPPEWRHFLQEADIPLPFLENSRSARQILDYVNLTLDSMETGSDFPVPLLNLTIDDFTDEEFIEILDSARSEKRGSRAQTKRHSVKFESLELNGESDGFQISESEKSAKSSGDDGKMEEMIEIAKPESEIQIIDLETNSEHEKEENKFGDRRRSESEDVGFHTRDRRGSRIRVLPPGPPKKRPSSGSTDSEKRAPRAQAPPVAPPPPPPPSLSFSVIPPPPPPPPIMSPGKATPLKIVKKTTPPERFDEQLELPVESDSSLFVTSARLQEQKTVLRSSLTPHPAQLRSLKTVPKLKLSNVAEVLKDALDCRRLAMMRESITARSDDYLSEPDDWSRRCSLAPTHRDTDRAKSRRSSRLDVKRQSVNRLSDEDDMTRRLLIQQALDKLRKEEARRASMASESWGLDAASQSTPRLEVGKRSRSLTPTMMGRISNERSISPNTKKD